MVWLGSRSLTGAALMAALLLAPRIASAQPAPAPLDLPAAPVVVTGRVASAASRWDASTGTIVTYVAIDVADRLRGDDVPARLVLKQLGGEVDGIGLWIADQATFRLAEDVLLFLSVSARDGTLHTTGLSRGKRVLDELALPLVRAQLATAPREPAPAFVAVPPEYDADAGRRAPSFTFLLTDGGYPARWHEVDDGQPVFVDHPTSLPGTWTGTTANATAAINLWRGSGMDLDLRDGGARLVNACPSAFTGNGRIAVAYNDPCGLADTPEMWVIGGGYYTTGDLRTVNGTEFQKFQQGFVVLNNAGPQTSSAGCFQDAITHGIGHALGLGHSGSAGAMMAALPSASCSAAPRGVGADDRAGVNAIYQGIATGPIPPGPPVGFTATALLSTVTLSWTENPTGGPAQRHIAEAGNTVSGVYGLGSATLGPATTAAFGNVPPGTYFLRARAQNAAGTSAPSSEAQVTVGACVPPGAPGTLTASTSGNSVGLQWSAPASGVTQGYLLATGSQPGASNLFVGALDVSPTALAAAVPFGTYYTRIHATNVCGVGPPSNEVTLVVQPCSGPPLAPTNMRFTKAGTFVTLSWDAAGGPPATSYTLVVGSQPGAADLLVSSTGTTDTSLAGPVPPGAYYVRILATNPCGQSGSSNEILVTVSAGDSLGLINALGATRFLAFGDSITEGITSSFDGAFLFAPTNVAYPLQLDGLLESSFTTQDFTVDNFGQGGEEVIRDAASVRLAQLLAFKRPQGLLLLEGINDLNSGRSVSDVVSALQQMLDVAQLYNATVLIGTMFQTCESVDPNTGRFRHNSIELIAPFNSAIKAMAAGRQNVYVVDIFALFGNNCGPDGGVGLLGGDGLHPNGNGYSVMAQAFGAAIRDRFPVRGSFQ